jgi:hypothetical protein
MLKIIKFKSILRHNISLKSGATIIALFKQIKNKFIYGEQEPSEFINFLQKLISLEVVHP